MVDAPVRTDFMFIHLYICEHSINSLRELHSKFIITEHILDDMNLSCWMKLLTSLYYDIESIQCEVNRNRAHSIGIVYIRTYNVHRMLHWILCINFECKTCLQQRITLNVYLNETNVKMNAIHFFRSIQFLIRLISWVSNHRTQILYRTHYTWNYTANCTLHTAHVELITIQYWQNEHWALFVLRKWLFAYKWTYHCTSRTTNRAL